MISEKSNFYLLNSISMILLTQANQDLYILWLAKDYYISLNVQYIISVKIM